MEELQIGQVVQLKSGGPKMTVEFKPDAFNVKCVWFVGSKLYRDEFKIELLQRVSV
jgi:uncharacterized protein YodC (DUF2158 family)